MRRLSTVMFAGAAVLMMAVPVQAANVMVVVPVKVTALEGTTVRRNAMTGLWRRSEVLKLQPNGAVTGNWVRYRSASGARVEQRGKINGKWSIVAGNLCLEGKGFAHDGLNCTTLKREKGNDKEEYSAVGPMGTTWQVFVEKKGVTE